MTETIEVPRVTKAKLNALERVFAAEIDGRMLQAKAKIYSQLAEEGYLEPVYETHGKPPFAVVCHGWALTHAGRITYCMSCDEAENG